MTEGPFHRAQQDLIALCYRGLDSAALRRELARCLRRAVPFDAAAWVTLDPATLLPTSAVLVDLPARDCAPMFENEYLQDDFNKFSDLSKRQPPVGVLGEVTKGALARSRRYGEILAPLGLAAELRAAFVVDDACWGAAAFYRRPEGPDFSPAEAALIAAVAEHVAERLRRALLVTAIDVEELDNGPGLLVLDRDNAVASSPPAAARWLAALFDGASPEESDSRRKRHLVKLGRTGAPVSPTGAPLPHAVYAVAAHARSLAQGAGAHPVNGQRAPARTARLRVRTRSGAWLVLHGSQLTGPGAQAGQTAVIIERAQPADIAPLIVQAYDLSEREQQVAQLVMAGESTDAIARTLHITPHTVQDHLKAIFAKTGVRSRRELVGQVFFQHYLPRLQAGASPGVNGWFAEAGGAARAH
ncbi:MAG: helix-turn-helix transcriptional regulator [Chloroflexi bacterium]|nr:helix-turn-helix transcriptional regulator [Chloroflexota bacterium]